MKPSSVYEPAEDSALLKKHIKDFAHGNVLDMGTGSGVLAKEAAKYADTVLGVDIDLDVVVWCEQFATPTLKFVQSDLFANVTGTYDLITFNPPYLPQDYVSEEMDIDKALYGGKEGYEVIEQFLKEAKKYLKEKGVILLLFSSASHPEKIKESMHEEGYTYKLLEKQHISFEDLFVYGVTYE